MIRSYHGHLSGVYCLSLHPTLDVLITGGRDSVARVCIRCDSNVMKTLGLGYANKATSAYTKWSS